MKIIKTVIVSILTIIFFGWALPSVSIAQEPDLVNQLQNQMNVAGKYSGLGTRDPRQSAALFVNYSLGILGILFIVYIVYAGFLYMTAGGEEEKVNEAKRHIKNGLIGLIIILLALSITLFVTTYLIRSTVNRYYQPPLQFEQSYP